MTGREFLNAPGMRYALGLLTLAVATSGWVAYKAYRVDLGGEPPAVAALSADLQAPPRVPTILVAEVVEADPFSQDRKPPAKRYRLPGEIDSVPRVTTAQAPRVPPRPTVLGTAISSDSTRTFATLALGTTPPKQYKVGAKIGDYTIVSIQTRKVVFVDAAGVEFEVTANK